MANTHGFGSGSTTTRVYALAGSEIPLDAVNGLVRCVHPGAAEHVSFGTVLNVGFDGGLNQSYMDVEDLEGRVLDAIKEIGCDLTVLCNYGNVAPPTQPVTSGHWDDVVYDSFTDTTTFTDNSGTFPAHAIDWWVQPDVVCSPKTGPGVMRVRDGLEAGKDCHETQATHTRTDHRPAA